MVERSNYMGSELSAIVKQMEAMDKSEEIRVIEETFMADMLAKEIELLIVSAELQETVLERKNIEKENKHLKDSILLDKEAEIAFLLKDIEEKEIQMLEKSQMLEMSSCKLQQDLDIKDTELRKMRRHEEELMADYCAVSRELEEMKSAVKQCESLSDLSSKECGYLMSTVDIKNNRVFSSLSEKVVSLEQRFEEIKGSTEKTHLLIEEFESLEKLAKEAISENFNLQSELDRKDKVLEGLEFDLQLLQESSSNKQDQKDEIEELTASVESLEYELDDNIAKIQMLESQLKEKLSIISTLETDVSREYELVKSLFSEIEMLTESVKNALKAKETTDVELVEAKKANESLEMELAQMESALFEMKALVESRTNDFNSVSCKRDDFYAELLEVRKELEMAHALSEENEAIATEAKQMAETSRLYAEEKEEEVKVCEKSVEELEHMVNVLESQVELVQGEAEKQRLQREELELEFQVFKQEINSVKSSDSDTRRLLNEKEKCLQEVLQRVQILEKEIVSKDSEILQHKAHISELNLHAEAQAREYKQTFKSLEAMADQVKSDGSAQHISNSPSKKLEKNASRTRGSGSPFKCMGMGLVQQMKSERDSELASARQRIEELESLAATRQKEIFALNAKLAMSGSMTHDVLRDLLNIKLDMTTYSSIVDGHQNEDLTEKARTYKAEGQSKDEEVMKLKQQLKEFVIERKGWMDEIERKQSEMIAAEIALEQLRQRDHLLATENEMFKKEIANHKMKVIKLEGEEENNALKSQNDELSRKLRRNDAILIRVKEELAKERAASGKNSYYVETELQLEERLKETEDERDRLAQKLAALCTNILKAAGVTGSPCDVTVSMAEEALEQFQTRVATLARELQDLQYKNRISNERVRLLEMMPQMADESQQTNSRVTRSPFFSTLDR
ncbi:kinesin-like protein KIN-12D [Tanacetum coccineum]|uniref:Kinesin-like protein KIN-12D n=1 Tax=Tanacetum coccineum TaxID=301880 RepID=A0ABQ5GFD5_9ASTR